MCACCGRRSWVAEGAIFFADMTSCWHLQSFFSAADRVKVPFFSQQPGSLNHCPDRLQQELVWVPKGPVMAVTWTITQETCRSKGLQDDFMLHCCHLAVFLINFIFELVFCNWSTMNTRSREICIHKGLHHPHKPANAPFSKTLHGV